jgi:alpha-galactosidase
MSDKLSVRTSTCEIRLEGDRSGFAAELSAEPVGPGVDVVTLRLAASRPAPPPRVRLVWSQPVVDVQGSWHPSIGRNRGLSPDWGAPRVSRVTSGAPIRCLYNLAGQNRLTFACSDALNAMALSAGVREETAEFVCSIGLFAEPSPPIDRYVLQIRIDTRDVPYWRAVGDVSDWWAGQPGYEPAGVPETARLPMYSTWYSFHQRLDTGAVVRQCELARQLGCEAVIVDDGWQTTDSSRGYAYCGDWRPERIADMAGFVRRVHEAGLKFLLWYSVPHVGRHCRAWRELEGKTLYHIDSHGASILDPRFPEVREYLIGLYERAMREWDLDGFKLDFVDCFSPRAGTPRQSDGDGRDYASVAEAADRLMSDVIDRLRRIKADVCIEFRQSYVGPLMRKYGNMFRAGDCPNDAVANRLRTVDIRLLCGSTAAHADMLMWHADDPVESAALQMLAILFSVPQISVLLDRIPSEHVEMLRFWLGFWRDNRDVLLDGDFEPRGPLGLYPVVAASTPDKRILAVYDNAVADAGAGVPAELLVVNATRGSRVVIDLAEPGSARRVQTYDCRGREVADETIDLPAGLGALTIPPAGLARLTSI